MKHKKDWLLWSLLALAIVGTAVMWYGILPARKQQKQKQAEAYIAQQSDALTHDIAAIQPYRNAYMGNASNTGHLFGSLPLAQYWDGFSMDSDALSVQINYQVKAADLDQDALRRDTVYDAVASMAAIDNLEQVVFAFQDKSVTYTRTQVKDVLGSDLSQLLEENNWTEKVQSRLTDTVFLDSFDAPEA